VTPVKPRSGRIATIRRKGSEAVKDRASARMPPGLIVRLAASSRPDAGPRLSDGRPNPPHGENCGQTGRQPLTTTRQRLGAHHPSGNRPRRGRPSVPRAAHSDRPQFHPRPRPARFRCAMFGGSSSARDALARSDVDPASVRMVKRAKAGVVCPVICGKCGWPQISQISFFSVSIAPGIFS